MIVPLHRQDAAAVADHYDELDRVYRDLWGEHVHHGYWQTGRETSLEAVEALADLVAAELAPHSGGRYCDIGCGYGATAARIESRFGAQVTGVTLSASQLAVAAARPGRLRFLQRDWLVNGFAEGEYDGAWAIESSEHMGDKQLFFDEAFRVIRPGGSFVVCAWLAAPAPGAWQAKHLLEPICREGRLAGMGTEAEYLAMAAKAGFRLRAASDISRKVRRTWLLCAGRLAAGMVRDPALRRFVLDGRTRNRVFALTVPRLIAAYWTGAMRYGLMTFDRP